MSMSSAMAPGVFERSLRRAVSSSGLLKVRDLSGRLVSRRGSLARQQSAPPPEVAMGPPAETADESRWSAHEWRASLHGNEGQGLQATRL